MKYLLATCSLCFGLCAPVLAEITDHDDYTHDSATSLYWLDVTLEGEQYDGYPLMGTDNIVTTDCVESSCHP